MFCSLKNRQRRYVPNKQFCKLFADIPGDSTNEAPETKLISSRVSHLKRSLFGRLKNISFVCLIIVINFVQFSSVDFKFDYFVQIVVHLITYKQLEGPQYA